ncbi:MAG: hypothetical protein UU21_C0013G0012 [Candidatus Levybacteria bacterium GW2011_GWA2_40_8]|nr:MAG: hypothetical protein UU21_C0013G0012 [Candidatus Levybacteria bacterium GW2011_GWA2_40_8]
MNSLISYLSDFYSKFPKLSSSVRGIVVDVMPWVALIAGFLLVIMAAIDLTSSPFVSILAGPVLAYLMLSAVLSLISGVLLLSSFLPLRKKQKKGWMLLFLVELLFILSPVLSFNLGNIILNLILAGIGFYLLFQVRHAYK